MEDCSLHPLDLSVVGTYVSALNESDSVWQGSQWGAREVDQARAAYATARNGNENGAIAVGFGLAKLLSEVQPSFFQEGLSLTSWEARIDRGIGMLIRPPSRFFIEAGLDQFAARAMPIRLGLSRGMMAGAFVPASLIDQLYEHFDARFERLVKRLVAAEIDPVPAMGLMFKAVTYARDNGLGLYEAVDVISPYALASLPLTVDVIVADKRRIDQELRKRIELAAKPPQKPGFFGRIVRPRG
jgi:hypothetical protein